MGVRALRIVLLVALGLVLALGAAACGGGDEAGDTGLTDTGSLFPIDTGAGVEPEAPPVEPSEPPAEVLQIEVPKPGESIGPASPAARVAELQRALLALGFKIGEPDGIYGPKTRKAVTRFQRSHKLEADGLVGPKTARAINKELRARASGGNA